MTATAVAEVAVAARATATATEAVAEGVAWMGQGWRQRTQIDGWKGVCNLGYAIFFVPAMHFEVAQIYMCIHCP